MRKICLISPLLCEYIHKKKFAGGAELQMFLLAKSLAQNNYNVIILVAGKNKKPYKFENFMIYEFDSTRGKIPFLHFFYKYSINFFQTLKNANADIYLQRSSSAITGLTALYCKRNKKKMIFQCAHTRDTDKTENMNFRDLFIYRYGLKNASKIIVQTNEQKLNLKKNHQIDSQIIKNFASFSTPEKIKNFDKKYFLWIGRISPPKQPKIFLEIVKALPDINFVAAGPTPSSYGKDLLKEFNGQKNLKYLGRIERKEILDLFSNGIALINTSKNEGFSNTWLEAWNYKVPIISLKVNPDSILTDFKLGFYSKTLEQMIKDIETLQNDSKIRDELGNNGWNYLQENHSVDVIMDKYRFLLNESI